VQARACSGDALAKASGAATPLSLAALLKTSFDAELTVVDSGVTYKASARDLLSSGTPTTWLAGPEATEWQVAGSLTASGKVHPQLAVRFNVRAYKGLARVRVAVIVENTWTYEPSPQNVTYDATVSVGGAKVYTLTGLTHYRQARWRKVFWWGGAPEVHVAHDTSYLIASRALPSYDTTVTVSAADLAKLGFTKASPLLEWKALLVSGRMTDPGFCWIQAASYSLNVRATSSGPLYQRELRPCVPEQRLLRDRPADLQQRADGLGPRAQGG